MLRIFLVILISMAAGGTATLLLIKPDPQKKNTQQILSSRPSTISTESIAEMEKLRAENIKLKNIIAMQISETSFQKNISSPSTSNTITPNNCDSQIRKLMAFFAEKDNILEEAKNIQSTSQYDKKNNDAFYAEDINETWAATTENKFLEEITKNETTRNIIISTINCRTSTCAIKIPTSTVEEKNKIMQALSNPSFTNSIGFNKSTIKSDLEILGGETTIYISNNN
jgi:hypothetical protein